MTRAPGGESHLRELAAASEERRTQRRCMSSSDHTFEIDGVVCKFEPGKGPNEWKNARVRIGMQLPSKQRVVAARILAVSSNVTLESYIKTGNKWRQN